MAAIHIPDALYERIQAEALSLDADTDELIRDILTDVTETHLQEQSLSAADLEHLQLGADQLKRGEATSSEEYMAWLSDRARVLAPQ